LSDIQVFTGKEQDVISGPFHKKLDSSLEWLRGYKVVVYLKIQIWFLKNFVSEEVVEND
jgi:hypothetical protein